MYTLYNLNAHVFPDRDGGQRRGLQAKVQETEKALQGCGGGANEICVWMCNVYMYVYI